MRKWLSIGQCCLSALLCTLLIVSTLLLRFTIPGTTVLVTTQLFFVLLYGLLFPAKLALSAIGVYILLGLVGLPVFSGISGPAVLFTPSFGYLLGFLAAAYSCALVKRHTQKGWLAAGAGLLACYLIALPCIALVVPSQTFSAFLAAYCLPFLPLDVMKAVLALIVARRLEKRLLPQSRR